MFCFAGGRGGAVIKQNGFLTFLYTLVGVDKDGLAEMIVRFVSRR